jgi:RHS repeat-associated protein
MTAKVSEVYNSQTGHYKLTDYYDATLYAGNLMTVSRNGLIKHYFAETERLAANVFTGGHPLVPTDTMLNCVKYRSATDFSENFTKFATEYFVRNANYEECKENKIEYPAGIRNLLPLHTIYYKAMGTGRHNKLYYFNANHLGSGSLITDGNGQTYQTLAYTPYGSQLVDIKHYSDIYNEPYRFGGKIIDEESGLNYFEARYYWDDGGFPISTDQHWYNYPHITSYNWCGQNPIMIIDPTGMDWVSVVVDGNTEVYYDRTVKSQADVNKKYGKKAGVTHLKDGSTLTTYDKDGNITAQYTFTNDSKENKYGTVTDMNGNVMDNSQITYGSNYTIFGTSDNSVNAETLHKNWLEHSSYIGPNNPKDYNEYDSYQYKPVGSPTEMAAYKHDLDYDALKAAGVSGALSYRTKCADMELISKCRKVLNNPQSSNVEKSRAKNIIRAFVLINTFK